MTSYTHICLLSEQPIPNLCPLFDSHITAGEVLFVVTPQQQWQMPRMEEVLRPRGIKAAAIQVDDAMNYQNILDILETEIKGRKALGQQLLINATGGTKPMSIAAHFAGYNQDIPVFYVQNDRVYWLETGVELLDDFDIEERLPLEPFIQAHGFTLVSRKPVQVRPEHMNLFRSIITMPSYSAEIKNLNFLAHQAEQSNKLDVALPSHFVNSESLQALFDKLQEEKLITVKKDSLSFTTRENRALCNGLWLEDFCYKEAESMKSQIPTLREVARSVEIKGQGRGREPVDNELDLVLLNNNRLYLIECKTRSFKNSEPVVDDALYKLEALRRKVGGLYAKAMLVSFYPVGEKYKKRAATLDITLVDGPRLLDNFRSELARWLD